MRKYLSEIENTLRSFPREIPPGIAEAYIGGKQSRLIYLGLKVPTTRQILKKGFSFSTRDEKTQAPVWDYVWNKSQLYEAMSLALDWQYRQEVSPRDLWRRIKPWNERVDNWAHADGLSNLYAQILEADPALVYPTLAKWNRSQNPWQRRLSIVSLFYYARLRKKFLPVGKIFPLVLNQLDHPHYYVQKGVGWVLRELSQAYPKECSIFLNKNLGSISAVAFAAAVEKINVKEKERLKALRKLARKGKIRS